MSLTPERHTEIDAELAAIEQRLIEIAQKIDDAAGSANHHGHAWSLADYAAQYVDRLRLALQESQRWRR